METDAAFVSPALVAAADSQSGLLGALQARRAGGEGSWRAAIFDPTPSRVAATIAAVTAGQPRRGRDGIYFSAEGLLRNGGRLAFLFPGIEATFATRIGDVARHFGLPPPKVEAVDLEHLGNHVLALNALFDRVTVLLGLRPDMIAGHSIGEWSGMMASGIVDETAAGDLMSALDPRAPRFVDASYVAVGAGAQRAASMIADLPDTVVSHDNCVHQSIVCGPRASIEKIASRLREQRIVHQVLPFRSGFHSPALAAHLAFYAAHLDRLKLAAAAVPLWSATTCAPYPSAPGLIRDLFLAHLVKPVRFRELVLALHDAGARAFVQVGSGSLAAFVDDVLVGRPHHAISLIAPRRAGMEQLRRACASLYVEGANVDLERLGLVDRAARASARQSRPLAFAAPPDRADSALALAGAGNASPVLRAFAVNMRELAAAEAEVLQAFAMTGTSAAATPHAGGDVQRIELSVAAFPELRDHCLIPQAPDWPTLADRAPAVPMTMSIALLMEAAGRLDPRRTPVAIEDVTASAWLYVEPPIDATISCRYVDRDRIRASIGDFVEGTVTLAERFPDAPRPSAEPLLHAGAFPIDVDSIYRDGWLFHGPRYRGVMAIDTFGPDGIAGTLATLPAKGALLDAAGQLVGLWVMQANASDRLSMPIRVGKVSFFGADPAPGELIACTVRIRHCRRHEVSADVELSRNGRLYARISAWQYWRFDTSGPILDVMREPARNLLAAFHAEGFSMLAGDAWTSSATMEFLARRFVSAVELQALGGMRQARRQRDWLAGRIVAKDSVRKLLFDRGHGPLFPMEIAIETDAAGRPHVKGPFTQDIRVSIAHKAGVACAIAAEGVSPGIDIEKIASRGEGFSAMAFASEEVRILPDLDRDEWLTRLWSAKEAAGKARGTGLAGNPKGLKLTRVEGERLLVNDRWVATRKHDDCIIAWTVQ